MDEYLYEISGIENYDSDLSDEENMIIAAYRKVRTNNKKKNQKENLYHEGLHNDFYGETGEDSFKGRVCYG